MDIEKAEMKKWKSREDNLISLRSISIVSTLLRSTPVARRISIREIPLDHKGKICWYSVTTSFLY
jgi:hypothetical protein